LGNLCRSRGATAAKARIDDVSVGEGVSDLLGQIEAQQERLRVLLTGRDPAALVERSSRGEWSVIENIRHLLFAEQTHLGRLVLGGQRWSPLGFNPETMLMQKKFLLVETEAISDTEAVLSAWARVHAEIRGSMRDDSPQVRKELSRNLRHLRSHVQVIERLLRPGRTRGVAESTDPPA
jgi:hypothetical protein